MSDIVERLYGWQAHFETEPENELLCAELGEAAKELKRLKAVLRQIADLESNPYEQDHLDHFHIAKEALGDE